MALRPEDGGAVRIDIGDRDLTVGRRAGRAGPHAGRRPQLRAPAAYLRLARDATSARFVAEVATDPDRVFTTADVVDGRLLLVDSQFDENPPSRNSEVVVLPFRA